MLRRSTKYPWPRRRGATGREGRVISVLWIDAVGRVSVEHGQNWQSDFVTGRCVSRSWLVAVQQIAVSLPAQSSVVPFGDSERA